MTRPVLLWGRPDERPLAAVRQALIAARAPVVLLEESRLAAIRLVFPADHPGAAILHAGGERHDLARFGGAYFRPYGTEGALARIELPRRAEAAAALECVQAALWAWADLAAARVLNRPTLMASNGSKPLQSRLLAACGFAIPETLVTASPAEARDFIARHGTVIYKSISGVRSIVATISDPHDPRLARLAACPVQFQARIPGTDVRVHVVGDDLFACEARSEADDYRYAGRAGHTTAIAACTLPTAIAARCHAAAHALGLPLCGLDLRRTPEGDWIAFEANPSPGFSYFAEATGAPIAQAIAALLMKEEDVLF